MRYNEGDYVRIKTVTELMESVCVTRNSNGSYDHSNGRADQMFNMTLTSWMKELIGTVHKIEVVSDQTYKIEGCRWWQDWMIAEKVQAPLTVGDIATTFNMPSSTIACVSPPIVLSLRYSVGDKVRLKTMDELMATTGVSTSGNGYINHDINTRIVDNTMQSYLGEVHDIIRIETPNNSPSYYKIDSYTGFEDWMIAGYAESPYYRPGDQVQIKTWDELSSLPGFVNNSTGFYYDGGDEYFNSSDMRNLCGQLITIRSMIPSGRDGRDYHYLMDGSGSCWSDWMIVDKVPGSRPTQTGRNRPKSNALIRSREKHKSRGLEKFKAAKEAARPQW